jgi:hypothetical protein
MIWQISADYTARSIGAAYRAGEYAKTTDERIARTCGGVERAALTKCVAEQVKASREDQRTEYDLQAQQDSAEAAFWMMIVGAATLLSTLAALWFVKRTLDATWKAVEEASEGTKAAVIAAETGREANEIARAGNRPIMVFTGYRIKRFGPPEEGRIDRDMALALLSPVFKNLGPMPALPTSCKAFRSYTLGNPTKEDLAKLRAGYVAQEVGPGMLVPPGGEYEGPEVIIRGMKWASVDAGAGRRRAARRPGEISSRISACCSSTSFPNSSRAVLDSLRQPLETGEVSVARANTASPSGAGSCWSRR